MNQCKHCNSTDITYVTDYEHFCPEQECLLIDNGWVCRECGCFVHESGKYFEYYPDYKYYEKVNYLNNGKYN